MSLVRDVMVLSPSLRPCERSYSRLLIIIRRAGFKAAEAPHCFCRLSFFNSSCWLSVPSDLFTEDNGHVMARTDRLLMLLL